MNGKRLLGILLVVALLIGTLCTAAAETVDLNSLTLDEIIAKAKEEGDVQSVGMPDEWANWKATWNDLKDVYGITHGDVDMSSAEEISMFEVEKNAPTKDIGDVGVSFGPVAIEKDVVQSYKTSYWDQVPDWAKDSEGKWMCPYYVTICFAGNMQYVDKMPTSWAELLEGKYKVSVGDVARSSRPQLALLSAAVAFGGDENNIMPGIEVFRKLAEQGRLDTGDDSRARIEKGEIELYITFDFLALEHKKNMTNLNLQITVPTDGAASSAYASVINKYAPHPYAAALAREYIFSDAGQINLARGFARPIRVDQITLPEDVAANLLPSEMYTGAFTIKDNDAWSKTVAQMGQLWQEEVLAYLQ